MNKFKVGDRVVASDPSNGDYNLANPDYGIILWLPNNDRGTVELELINSKNGYKTCYVAQYSLIPEQIWNSSLYKAFKE